MPFHYRPHSVQRLCSLFGTCDVFRAVGAGTTSQFGRNRQLQCRIRPQDAMAGSIPTLNTNYPPPLSTDCESLRVRHLLRPTEPQTSPPDPGTARVMRDFCQEVGHTHTHAHTHTHTEQMYISACAETVDQGEIERSDHSRP